MGDKSAANAVAAIYKSRENDLWRLIFALGHPSGGAEGGPRSLAAHFGTMDALLAATEEELTADRRTSAPSRPASIRPWVESPQSP